MVSVLEDLELDILLEGDARGVALVDGDHQVFHGVCGTGGRSRPVVAGRGAFVINRDGRVGERCACEGSAVALADVRTDVGHGAGFDDVVPSVTSHGAERIRLRRFIQVDFQ